MALPELVFAHASPHSIGRVSMFEPSVKIQAETVGQFSSAPTVTASAVTKLRQAGFQILQITHQSINFAGAPELFKKAFGRPVVEQEVPGVLGGSYTHLSVADSPMLGFIETAKTSFGDVLEGIALDVPRQLFSPNPTPPDVDYWHLKVPTGVAVGCNSSLLHQLGVTGAGIKVAMVDSGWYRHPFFTAQGYSVAPVVLGPGASEPDHDESGHGTGESANILAVAPGCQLLPVKASFVNTIGAFNAAVALQPDIITCSWGSHTPFALSAADHVLSASIAAAKAAGITVIFSAGNGHAGFPGQHPDVISAGGVFMGPEGGLQASDYSSGFDSVIFPGRRVPDVCGLVGMRPKAIYIMLPVEPGDQIDAGNATGGPFPDSDGTAVDDGWAAFSGTSAAAPQLAGVAALLKQVVPNIAPCVVKAVMMATARDVTEGTCSVVGGLHQGIQAGPGPDSATGSGLINAYAAVEMAYALLTTSRQTTPTARAMTAGYMASYYNSLADSAQMLGAPAATVASLRAAGAKFSALV